MCLWVGGRVGILFGCHFVKGDNFYIFLVFKIFKIFGVTFMGKI